MKSRKLYSPYAVVALRIVIGALFIFSGIAKAVDPWGAVFKIEDYFMAWGINEPRTIIFVAAVALSTLELTLGFMLLAGGFKRASVWLLTAMMAFMLPLSLYIWIASPVDDCGCFGDALKISNPMTFWKNVAITGGLIYLCRYNRYLRRGVYRPAIQAMAALFVVIYSIALNLYGYNVQPMLDFRPYPVGTDMRAALAGDEADDEAEIEMVYERDGERRTFGIDNLPDSTWTFVERVDRSISAGEAPTFAIYDEYDDDITSDVISSEGDMLFLVIPESNRIDIAFTYATNEFDKAVRREGGSMVALLSSTPEGIAVWRDLSMADYPCYIVEDTSLKQLARGTMALVYLHDGVIKWKRALSAFDFATIDALSGETLRVSDIKVNDKGAFIKLTLIVVAILLFIAFTQEFLLRLLPKKQKKLVNLQSDKPVTEEAAKNAKTALPSEDLSNQGGYGSQETTGNDINQQNI